MIDKRTYIISIIIFSFFVFSVTSFFVQEKVENTSIKEYEEKVSYLETQLEKTKRELLIFNEKEKNKFEKYNNFEVYTGRINLEDYIKENKKMVIEFRASWCSYCREFEDRLPDILEEAEDLFFLQIDIDNFPKLSMEYEAYATPTFILFENGNIKKKVIGALPTEQFVDWIEN